MRVALGVAYDGSDYHGWQRQPRASSVQACLEDALTKVAAAPVDVICAGRTDSGVHATEQVVHFDSAQRRPMKAWVRGTNNHLPAAIKVQWAVPVDETFHARFSATARCYHYLLYQQPAPLPSCDRYQLHFPYPLSVPLMEAAIPALLGKQDFSSFRGSSCQARTPIRCLHALTITETTPGHLCFTVRANAFLHHMVRNLMGSLLWVGQGRRDPAWLAELLAAKDRRVAGPCASPRGLHLMSVTYPEPWSQLSLAALAADREHTSKTSELKGSWEPDPK